MKLSPNFTLSEMTTSRYADRHGIDEQFDPPQNIIDSLKTLCEKTLQPLRDAIGSAIAVTSGYRCPEVNRAIGGSPSSFHRLGMAADIKLYMGGQVKNSLLFKTLIENGIPFTELIWEFGTEVEPSWVHVAFSPTDSRRMIKHAIRTSAGTKYLRLTQEEALELAN